MRGINAISALAGMPGEECIVATNILPEDFGCEVRDGYVEWANGWTGDFAKTVITFEGNTRAEDQLWVANDEGIWNVTVQGTTSPVQELVWPSSAGQAGVCSYINFTNDGLDRFILLCDGENGYYVWTQSTGLWTQGSFSGGSVAVELLNFVMVWKERVWFVQRDSALAWYLPTGSFSGVAAEFNFGAQFRFGGQLVSLHNWTLDGGLGIDDHLVGISGAGDVIIYAGTDPADAGTFGLVGSWYVGEVPFGNRIASEFSGELYIMCVQGLLAMSQVLNGANVKDDKTYVTAKVAPYMRKVLDTTASEFGWQVHVHPKQSLLFINTPPRFAKPQIAFTLYFGSMAWGIIRGLDKSHTANWQGDVYWTDNTRNKIFVQRGFVDAVYIAPDIDGQPQAIEWDLLTAYTSLEKPATYKRVQYIRPMFVGSGAPAFNVKAVYDFDIHEISAAPAFSIAENALWGNAGDYIHSLIADSGNLVYISFGDGTAQLTGVDTIDITITGHPLFTVTWSVANERYEVVDAGVFAFITGIVGVTTPTTINPDILVTSDYNYTPAVIGADVGFTVPDVNDDAEFEGNGTISPAFIVGTNAPAIADGIWNLSEWSGGVQTTDNPRGARGLGRWIAINIRGRSSDEVTLVGFDLIYDVGGLM